VFGEIVPTSLAQAPHVHHHHPAEGVAATVDSTTYLDEAGVPAPNAHLLAMSALMPDQPMARDGSGTSWHPDASAVEGIHAAGRRWQGMLHGALFARYSYQDVFDSGRRGGRRVSAPNWIMGMGVRPLGSRAQLAVRAMVTAEPFTQGGAGYPLLFQTGETYRGVPLVDRQHPHDLIAELSTTLSASFGRRSGAFLYLALPGEPALGPPAFMHRPSARHLPDSPIGHHWQDATHVTFGVATAGICYGRLKLDASVFTGREPDEERLGFDRPRFDSFSARASLNMGAYWAIHVASGFIREPEAIAPGEDIERTTAGLLYAAPAGRGALSATAVWGYNRPTRPGLHRHADGSAHLHSHHAKQHALLAEFDWSGPRQAFFGRAEYVQKTGGELGLPTLAARTFWLGAGTVGTARRLVVVGPLKGEAGAQITVHRVPGILRPIYGDRPVAGQVYLRVSVG
jgi:hypothetical protein